MVSRPFQYKNVIEFLLIDKKMFYINCQFDQIIPEIDQTMMFGWAIISDNLLSGHHNPLTRVVILGTGHNMSKSSRCKMHDNLKSGHRFSFVHRVSFALFYFSFQSRVALLVCLFILRYYNKT